VNTKAAAARAFGVALRDQDAAAPVDYAATEKISDLPRRLSTEGAPPGSDPSIGDITYYSPWGNLALFYKDFGYSKGLVKLGKIDSGVKSLNRHGPMRATIELIEK
jgi:hypothetical protein